jgi:hypothetical protein
MKGNVKEGSTDMNTKVKPAAVVGGLGYVLLVVVAIVSWSLSARHLHAWGMKDLHESNTSAWFVPATFDLAPCGLSLVVYQARRKGRSAAMWRLFIVAFTGVSSWINWTWTTGDASGSRLIAASLPIAAVVLFEALTWQVHRDAMDKVYDGQPIPRVPLIAWFVDFNRAYAVTKASALRPLDAAESTLRAIQETNAATRKPQRKSQAAVAATPETLAIAAPKPAKKTAARDRVLDFKIDNPDASQAEIATALQVSAATVSRALNGVRASITPDAI